MVGVLHTLLESFCVALPVRKDRSSSCVSINRYPGLVVKRQKASVRAAQSTGPFEPPEPQALKHVKQQGCKVVPELLGYQFGEQEKEGIIPGGFVTYVIWKKVPGEALEFTRFWNCTFSGRQDILVKFRQIYKYVAHEVSRANMN